MRPSLSDLGDAIGEAFSSLGEAQADLIKATDELAEQEEWGLWKKIKEAVRIAASSFLKTSRISTLTVVAFVGRCVMELAFFGVQALAAGIHRMDGEIHTGFHVGSYRILPDRSVHGLLQGRLQGHH